MAGPVIGGSAALAVAGQLGLRDDPYFGYNFLVEIQGLIAGGFVEVTGLSVSTEVLPVREGGLNTHEHKLPGVTSYGDLTFRRGMANIDLLYRWYQDVIKGKVVRRSGTIFLLSHLGIPVKYWNFARAFPVAWDGPQFDAMSSEVIVTSMRLAHEGLSNPLGV